MRRSRGLTMVELLVTLGVIAIAMGGVLSVFFAAFGYSRRGRERAEAARTALAVFGLVDRGFSDGTNYYGRQPDGNLPAAATAVTCKQLATAQGIYVSAGWAPSYVTRTSMPLVWKCTIEPHPSSATDKGCEGLHLVTITISRDDDLDDSFDERDSPGDVDVDTEIARFSAHLADEELP